MVGRLAGHKLLAVLKTLMCIMATKYAWARETINQTQGLVEVVFASTRKNIYRVGSYSFP